MSEPETEAGKNRYPFTIYGGKVRRRYEIRYDDHSGIQRVRGTANFEGIEDIVKEINANPKMSRPIIWDTREGEEITL